MLLKGVKKRDIQVMSALYHTTIMCVMPSGPAIAFLYLEDSFPKLLLPIATKTLKRTPVVQNIIDEFIPPALSILIWNIHHKIGEYSMCAYVCSQVLLCVYDDTNRKPKSKIKALIHCSVQSVAEYSHWRLRLYKLFTSHMHL